MLEAHSRTHAQNPLVGVDEGDGKMMGCVDINPGVKSQGPGP